MSSSPNLSVTLGTVNGAPIIAVLDGANFQMRRSVTIGATPYLRSPPKDWPDANPGVPILQSLTANPQTIGSGVSIIVFQAEAAALVNAGAATLGAIVSNG